MRIFGRNKKKASSRRHPVGYRTGVPPSAPSQPPSPNPPASDFQSLNITSSLEENLRQLKEIFKGCDDLVVRPLSQTPKSSIAFFKGMADRTTIDRDILGPLLQLIQSPETGHSSHLTAHAVLQCIQVANTFCVSSWQEIVLKLPVGHVLLLIDGEDQAILAEAQGFETRTISPPEREIVVRGPDEAFTENLETILSQIRRRLPVPELKVKQYIIGQISQTRVCLLYLENIVNEDVLQEVIRRLDKLDIDFISEGNKIQEFISDHPYSPFPQMLSTERPDRAAFELNHGKVVIAISGSPYVLIVPNLLVDGYVTVEDYYHHFTFVTALRVLRYLNVLVALLGPSVYIALTTYHIEALPTALLINLASSREGVPFPALVEALLMEVAIESLREAGIRLPRQVGQTISIVGALIIGEAAVQAGLVSQAMVVVVAITGIAGFTIPAFEAGISIRLLRFPMMFLSATLGMYGVLFGTLLLLIHLSHLRSFGIPYLAPLTPTILPGWKDLFWRLPLFSMPLRKPTIVEKNQKRYGKTGPIRSDPRRREE
jgi:spore germination protein KA